MVPRTSRTIRQTKIVRVCGCVFRARGDIAGMTQQAGVVTEAGDVPVIRQVQLPPSPNLVKSLGLNHAFETAVADLVDNSLDAGASHILIRLVTRDGLPVRFYMVDDGRGIAPDDIDRAMTLGERRDYHPGALGHFGVGLKGASLGQAESLIVASRAAGSPSVGRRLLRSKLAGSFECDVLADAFAASELDRRWEGVETTSGTVVRWDGVKRFDAIHNPDVAAEFIEDQVIKLRHHLGLVFHRVLERGQVVISVDVEELTTAEVGPPYQVETD